MELKTEQFAYIEQRLSNDRKSTLLAYALWFFLGLFGAHRFYLRQRFAWLQPILGGVALAGLGMSLLFLLIVCRIDEKDLLGLVGTSVCLYLKPLLLLMGLPGLVLKIWLIADAILMPRWLEQDLENKRAAITAEISSAD